MIQRAGAVLGMVFLTHAATAQFVQQGNKLVGSDAGGAAQLGTSVAISGDGSTAIVGGCRDSGTGAAWVFTRGRLGVWFQEGSKLVGTGTGSNAEQGASVAISADGNTAVVGGPQDAPIGAAWVYTRSLAVWSQQGSKLVGTGAVGDARQGTSVAISADANTAIVGGNGDNSNARAAWVFSVPALDV